MSTAAERDYLLGTDDEELRRLQAQHDTWRPETADLWEQRGAFWRLMGRRSSRIFSGTAPRQPACSKSRSP